MFLLVEVLFFILCLLFLQRKVVHEINIECTIYRDVKGKLLKNSIPFYIIKGGYKPRLYMVYCTKRYSQELVPSPVIISKGFKLNSFVIFVSSCLLSIPSSLKRHPFNVTVSAVQSSPA